MTFLAQLLGLRSLPTRALWTLAAALVVAGAAGRPHDEPLRERATAPATPQTRSAQPPPTSAVRPPPALEEEAETWDPSPRVTPRAPRGRGYLGVSVDDLDRAQSVRLGLQAGGGAVIREVDAYGPGSRGHLLPGDVVVAIEGIAVHGEKDLSRIVEAEPAGVPLAVNIVRHGERYTARVVSLAAL